MDYFRRYFLAHNKEDGKVQLDFLDSIDFTPILKDRTALLDIMRDVEDVYDYGYKRDKIPPELHGCAFNIMDEYDFGQYLKERYPEWNVVEQVRTWHELVKDEWHGANA
jgi:hypothetical protein